VSPPPSLAASNQQPLTGKFTIPLQNGKSQAGVFRTADSQAVIVLLQGAIRSKGQTSVVLTIDQLAPSSVGPPPAGDGITGNVFRFDAASRPGGQRITQLAVPSELVLVYPAPPSKNIRHTIIVSVDGRSWKRVRTVDSAIQHQASSSNVTTLAYTAVVEPKGASTGGGSGSSSSGGSVVVPLVVAGAIVVLVVVALIEYRRRRRPGPPGRHSGSGGPLRGPRR
jgi:hypothetical protein